MIHPAGGRDTDADTASTAGSRKHLLERVDDAAIAQIYADGFEKLPLKQKILAWHLYQAAVAGRDIFYDQKHRDGLAMRDVLEAIVTHGDSVEPSTLSEIQRYTKLFWLNSGAYNNLTSRKFVLRCSPEALRRAVRAAEQAGARFPLRPGESQDGLLARLEPMFFDQTVDPTVTSKVPPNGQDILSASANNLYSAVRVEDLEGVEERYALNSRLVRNDGRLVEEVYRLDGRYGQQITAIVAHLEAAIPFADAATARSLEALIRFYRTGEKTDREAYDVAWVADKDAAVDTINGFIEVYLDARGIKGAWEALVFYVDQDKTKGIERLAAHAQWFEDHMPWNPKYRKQGVQGITANAIDVIVETGESGPITPLGINLPNDEAIREAYGSKSVTLSNVGDAYDKAMPRAFRHEFAWSVEEVERAERWASRARELAVGMHEVIGHGSGKVAEHLKGMPQTVLKEQYSSLEEARADLVALYFMPDPELVVLGLMSAEDQPEIVQVEYEEYTRNVLLQLRRVREGAHLEDDHMRNRQMIVHWLMANTPAIDVRTRDGKTYYVVSDVPAFRVGVGDLLARVQEIKAEGDYPAAKDLFDTYGTRFDPRIRDEIVARVDRLQLPSYTGFVMPKLSAQRNETGAITDVAISYPTDFTSQMLEYSALTRSLRG